MAIGKRVQIPYLMRAYLTREPVILALLTVLAIVLFLVVGGLSRAFHAQQESLGQRWFSRGVRGPPHTTIRFRGDRVSCGTALLP